MTGLMGPQVPGRPSGLPPMVEMPAVPIRAQSTPGSRLTTYLLRPVWLRRRELGLSLVTVALVGGAWRLGDWPVALGVVDAEHVPAQAAPWSSPWPPHWPPPWSSSRRRPWPAER
ncbi:hypothetical protein ACTWPT_58340 [Nonomuraea sp. 3N208]|uniref:hypothetical protein n=1 Tax=Nonomuraea sp. 3N208 TaxID=3457421 RepID=UPI003FD31B9D